MSESSLSENTTRLAFLTLRDSPDVPAGVTERNKIDDLDGLSEADLLETFKNADSWGWNRLLPFDIEDDDTISDIPLYKSYLKKFYEANKYSVGSVADAVEKRAHWNLPDEEQLEFSGPDWLLLLLDHCSMEQRDMVKLFLWRAWTSHNNVTHQSGPFQIEGPIHCLLNIREITMGTKVLEKDQPMSRKGKEALVKLGVPKVNPTLNVSEEVHKAWEAPKHGWTKINVDGSFVEQTGEAEIGVIARNYRGEVLFTASRVLLRCASALEAEALACVEGIRLATQWNQGPIILETDCARMVKVLKAEVDRSDISFIITEAKELARLLSSWEVLQVKRMCISIAHE